MEEENSAQAEEPTQGANKRKMEDTEEAPNKKARHDVRPEQWKKFELLNPSFEEYYKVRTICCTPFKQYRTNPFWNPLNMKSSSAT